MTFPDAVAIDANGYWWRVWGEDPNWSMVPVNPDNSPIPQPVKFYRRCRGFYRDGHWWVDGIILDRRFKPRERTQYWCAP